MTTPTEKTDIVLSICTLVTDHTQYSEMLESCDAAGFRGEKVEFLQIDNSVSNAHDAYTGISHFLDNAQGQYVVVCHQDILFIEEMETLLTVLNKLDASDPRWAVAGNSGFSGVGRWHARITDPHEQDTCRGPFPAKVTSLDENFLVFNKKWQVRPSSDLQGFHFYGLDVCLQARFRGLSAYVIDFHINHLSSGKISPSFYECRDILEAKYQSLAKASLVQTTCELVFLGGVYRLRALRQPLRKLFVRALR